MNREIFEHALELWNQAGASDLSKTLECLIQSRKSASLIADWPYSQLPGLCCLAAGGDPGRAELVSSAWGLLYFAAHLLDSVADGEIPVSESGVSTTLAAACISGAGLLLTSDDQPTIPSPAMRTMRKDFFQAILTACNGQINDLIQAGPSLKQCWQMAAEKTGEIYALACRSGARVGNRGGECIDFLSSYGLHLGILIQIADDMDGLWRKNDLRSDLSRQKWTLPVAYAMEVSSNSYRAKLKHCLESAGIDPESEAKAPRIIIESGAMLYLVTMANWHYAQAERSLTEAAQPGPARDELQRLLKPAVPQKCP